MKGEQADGKDCFVCPRIAMIDTKNKYSAPSLSTRLEYTIRLQLIQI